jgi:hypothetical protein
MFSTLRQPYERAKRHRDDNKQPAIVYPFRDGDVSVAGTGRIGDAAAGLVPPDNERTSGAPRCGKEENIQFAPDLVIYKRKKAIVEALSKPKK